MLKTESERNMKNKSGSFKPRENKNKDLTVFIQQNNSINSSNVPLLAMLCPTGSSATTSLPLYGSVLQFFNTAGSSELL